MAKRTRLIADYENGEGKVRLGDEFKSQSALMRADILKDWIFELEERYAEARRDMRKVFVIGGSGEE